MTSMTKQSFFNIIIFSFLFIFCINLSANEKDIISLGQTYYKNHEYYNTISEMMRYQFLYPNGKYYKESILLEGLSYYNGLNYYKAVEKLSYCFNNYQKSKQGEQALVYLAYIRMLDGSPYFANRTVKEYLYIYPNGNYLEKMEFELISSYALMGNLRYAKIMANKFIEKYPNSKYLSNVQQLKNSIDFEKNRNKKSVPVAVIGSIFLPGFGYFYTGNYKLGTLSFLSNAALIALIANGIRNKNMFQIVFFSLIELSFYQNSIFGGIKSVRKYNSRDNFDKELRLGIKKRF